MNIKILKQNPNELKIEIEGAGHGICNLLQKKLLEDPTVDQAGYDVPHPLASNPVIYVRMKDDHKPQTALLQATEKALQQNQEFTEALNAALSA